MKAPDQIIQAVLDTLKYSMVYCRNQTLHSTTELREINEIMEAIHELPDLLIRWPEDAMDTIRIHLRCFDSTRWTEAPDLLLYFEDALNRAKDSN